MMLLRGRARQSLALRPSDLRSHQVREGMPLNKGKVPVGPGTALVSYGECSKVEVTQLLSLQYKVPTDIRLLCCAPAAMV